MGRATRATVCCLPAGGQADGRMQRLHGCSNAYSIVARAVPGMHALGGSRLLTAGTGGRMQQCSAGGGVGMGEGGGQQALLLQRMQQKHCERGGGARPWGMTGGAHIHIQATPRGRRSARQGPFSPFPPAHTRPPPRRHPRPAAYPTAGARAGGAAAAAAVVRAAGRLQGRGGRTRAAGALALWHIIWVHGQRLGKRCMGSGSRQGRVQQQIRRAPCMHACCPNLRTTEAA